MLFSTRIIRQASPENSEFPFASLNGFLTPTERFFVRNHFPVPAIDPASWRLEVEGGVERPLALSLAEIEKMPERTVVATMECAGNGRAMLSEPVKGVQWQLGAVSTAAWTGVPLGALLERAGARGSAVEVILEGADAGEIADPPSPGAIHFARSLPLTEAERPEVLLAYRMNDRPLTPEHGFPLRAVIPGWYGMASVKWLTRLVVTDRPFPGFFQTLDYTYWERRDGLPALAALAAIPVKAQIARPAPGDRLGAGETYRVTGAAWAGTEQVAGVEVSADGGATWAPARLLGEAVPYAWRLWELEWRAPEQPGPVTLMARATDARGRTQPMRRDPDHRNYMVTHVLPVRVELL